MERLLSQELMYSRVIHHGVPPFSRANGFAVVTGKVRYLCSIISSESLQEQQSRVDEEAYSNSCDCQPFSVSLGLLTPSIRVQS